MTVKVIVIDDEDNLRKLLRRIVELEGYKVFEAGDAKSGMKLLENENIQVVISDVKLPDANGIDLTSKIKSLYPSIEIIVLTAYGTIEDGVKAIKNGAFDYLTKGDHQDKIIPLLAKASEKAMLQQKIATLENRLSEKYGFERVLGISPLVKQAVDVAKKVSASDATVLLTGETGTGKEIFANAIHYESHRKQKPFVAVNCSALGKDILESELFGHRAGAFTGAFKDKKGLFEEAHGGTIFLDEIGEMNLDLQAKLLRVLETGTFIKVGDTTTSKVDVRVISATNRDLKEEITKENFREDLFYRLSVFQINLPSLRDRKDDIELLANFFIRHFAAKVNKNVSGMTSGFLKSLKHHSWKGNIRELKNVIERAVILTDTQEVSEAELPIDFYTDDELPGDNSFDLATAEKKHIKKILAWTKGNKTQAAKLLGIGLTTLYQKIKDYGI